MSNFHRRAKSLTLIEDHFPDEEILVDTLTDH
jgi:hypothetical protein